MTCFTSDCFVPTTWCATAPAVTVTTPTTSASTNPTSSFVTAMPSSTHSASATTFADTSPPAATSPGFDAAKTTATLDTVNATTAGIPAGAIALAASRAASATDSSSPL